jgi:hypothetical protein
MNRKIEEFRDSASGCVDYTNNRSRCQLSLLIHSVTVNQLVPCNCIANPLSYKVIGFYEVSDFS